MQSHQGKHQGGQVTYKSQYRDIDIDIDKKYINREIVNLFKIRNYVSQKIQRTIYFEIFDSNLNYSKYTSTYNSNGG